jgi:hypothetical protein
MILSILIVAIVGGIAYYHYAQGFFSATFSAVCAAIAAVLAISYHEPVITGLLQGAMADYAVSMVLIGLFAIIYIVLRTICDTLVPGNIRLPNTIDRVGGAVMGIVAAVFAGGIVALAAQALPFGPSIGGYARYEVESRDEVNIPGAAGRSQRTADVHDQLTETTFTPEKQKKLLLPVDEWVLGIVQGLSNGGSLEGDRTLTSIHPSYPDELFAQRLGIQIGASHTAINLQGKSPQVTVPDPGVFRVDQDLAKGAVDSEVGQVHDREPKVSKGAKDLQLVVRVLFGKDASDSDHKVRLAPASVRLCADGVNYFPVGTLERGSQLWENKVDDFLIVDVGSEDRGADFVFYIDDPSSVVTGGAKDPVQKIKDGVFVEVKRYAKIDLSGREVKVGVPASPKARLERKPAAVEKAKEKGGGAASGDTSAAAGGGGAGAAAAAATPPSTDFVFSKADISKTLFSPVNVGSPDADIKNSQIPDGTLSTQSKQFTQLDIQPTRSLTMLGQGGYAISELFEPPGKKLVQIVGTPPAEGGDAWAWGQLSKWQLTDAAGHSYTPAGAFAKVKQEQSERMVASYRSEGAPKDIAASEGRPMDVWIAFLVPSGTHLKKVTLNGKSVADLDQAVP